jgi:hypothetical protein
MIDADQVKELAGLVKSGLLAAFGGVVGYAADVVRNGKPFSWVAYAVFVATAFFVGQVLDSWLPSDMPGRGGLLMVAGTAAYPVLTAMQARIVAIVDKLR